MADPTVEVSTNHGAFVIALDQARAPNSVENFLRYVDAKFYDGTLFHRVIPTFMVQGGGYDQALERKPTREPVASEADNGLKNARGTVAMARTSDPHSATAQFFVNVNNNTFLNYPGQDGHGYTVFAKVVSGLDVVQKMGKTPTGPGGPFPTDVPRQPIVIEAMTVVGTK